MTARSDRVFRDAVVPALIAAAVGALLTGCESTQSKSARLEKEGGGLTKERGLVVRKSNPEVKVLWTEALQDENGSAAVVALRNTGKHGFARLPVAIDVKDQGGKSIFKNNTPGLQQSLTEAPLLRPGATFLWVNDQITAAGRPRNVRAKVGMSRGRFDSPPRIKVSGVRLRADPVDGTGAIGIVTNDSRLEQRKLVLYGVVRRGRRVTAAGRALVNRLKPHKRTRFQLFFIGDPRKGQLSIAAPPTVLG
jgi:hypothetical protein